jgi:hypothetical protein
MERSPELQTKLDRAQAQVERGVGHIARQKALVAHRLVHGQDATPLRELLVTLEETQRLQVEHRDLLRKELVGALLVSKESELDHLNRKLRRRLSVVR